MALPRRKTRKKRVWEGRRRSVLKWLGLLLSLAWGALVIGAYATRNSLAGLVLLGAGCLVFLTSADLGRRKKGRRRRTRRAPVAKADERTGR